MARLSSATCMLEAGTFRGVTTRRCARHFENIWSVELSAQLCLEARDWLVKYLNVEILQGDVVDVLPQILKRSDVRNLLVFLDAHYSGESTAMGPVEEPVLEELMILKAHKKQMVAIVIDDLRTFGSSGMPSKSAVLKLLEEYFSEFAFNVHLDQVIAIKKPHNKMNYKLGGLVINYIREMGKTSISRFKS